jgi:hypothetical protein
MAGDGGEGPEGLKKIYESLSIGFQVNRAIRIEHIMKRGLFGGFGLGGSGERSRLESRLSRSTRVLGWFDSGGPSHSAVHPGWKVLFLTLSIWFNLVDYDLFISKYLLQS